MTLEEAIRLLEQDANDIDYDYDTRLPDAERLGIEAIKRVKLEREYYHPSLTMLLPGETK